MIELPFTAETFLMMLSIAEDEELLNEVSIRCDIRRQVWGEFYDVFGYMLSDTIYGELIEEEIERRYKLHCLKEEEVMNKMKKRDVPEDETVNSTVAVCDENSVPQQVEEDVEDDTQKEGASEEKENNFDISYVLQNITDF